MADAFIEGLFPACSIIGYLETSPATHQYNCIAWAAGVTTIPWWPIKQSGVYWPVEVPSTVDVAAFEAAYATLGYQRCDNGELEEGYEKIAIYADKSGKPTHAARQLVDGKWTSKLGKYKDITHNSPAALEGISQRPTSYGSVVAYLRRRRK